MSSPFRTIIPLLLAPGALCAQSVEGIVIDRTSGNAVPEAHVQLLDRRGEPVTASVSARDGSFRVRAPRGGRYTLRAERIGYAAAGPDPVEIAPGERTFVRLALEPEQLSLEGIVVTGTGARCERRPETGAGTSRVWQRARRALESARAAAWESHRFTVRSGRRELDPESGRVLRSSTRVGTVQGIHPFPEVPLDDLAASGFVEQVGDGFRFHTAGPAVLLSDAFLDHHCFRLVEPVGGGRELIGLAFEPVRERTVPEIEGTLWVERATGDLRRVEFGYTGTRPAALAEHAGGEMELVRLPSGPWVVRSWSVRAPILTLEETATFRDGELAPRIERRWAVVGLREETGEIVAMATLEGKAVELSEPGASIGSRGSAGRGIRR